MGLRITGLGRTRGDDVLTNEMLEEHLDTTHEWIVTRTGIRERRVAAPGQSTATMAAEAARGALKVAGRSDVDVIIVATTTPETPCPSTASWVQEELGATGAAFDLQAACAGWVYGLAVAAGLLQTAAADSILLIGSETLSRIVNRKDRATAPLFGDAAGAAVLERDDDIGDLLATDLGGDGSLAHLLQVPAGGARVPASHETIDKGLHTLEMAGRQVFRAASRVVVETCRVCLARAGKSVSDVDLFVPHQANARIISYAADRLGISLDRTVVNIDRYGNTSSASVPVALCEAWENGRATSGDTVLLAGFGAGMSWGSAVLNWSLSP